ncbi:YdbL family protein [Parapedomonas caeni]|jgi:uncharacterized protein YdbL (DUF1318 family)
MTKISSFMTPLALAFALGMATPAVALADTVVEQARAAGQVGEQADGYLGIKGGASADVKARVDQINIKRRAVYTDLAAKKGASVNDVAGATACELFKTRVAPGEFYRTETGAWVQRKGSEPVKLPPYCPQ